MSAFADALGVLFLDANLSVEIWHRDSEGQFTRARGILRRPDEITEFGSARLMSDTTRIDVRVADILDPRPQEQILMGDETFLIQGEPRRDRGGIGDRVVSSTVTSSALVVRTVDCNATGEQRVSALTSSSRPAGTSSKTARPSVTVRRRSSRASISPRIGATRTTDSCLQG